MFNRVPALSQRLSRLRTSGRVASDARRTSASRRGTSLGETMAVGLGCDSYKRRG